MKIRLTRTGGVAGMRLSAQLSTEAMAPEEANHLRRLISDGDLFRWPERLKSSRPQPDRFQFCLVLEEGARSKRLLMDESAVPPEVRPLLDYLLAAAMKAGSCPRRRGR